MSDITATGRFYRNMSLGNVQAWSAEAAEPAVCLSVYAGIQHKDTASYIAQTFNFTAGDARDLGASLIAAAEYAENVETGEKEAA